MIASIIYDIYIYDSRCGMSDVAFCTAPPNGGPSCYERRRSIQAEICKQSYFALSEAVGVVELKDCHENK